MKKLFILLLVLLTFGISAYAADVWTAMNMIQSNPDKAFEIVAGLGLAKNDSSYERFMKLYVLLNKDEMSESEFNKYITPFYELNIKSAGTPVKYIKVADEKGTKARIQIDLPENRKIILNMSMDEIIKIKNKEDVYSFTGIVKKVFKDGEIFYVDVIKGGFSIIGGPGTVSEAEDSELIKLMNGEKWEAAAELSYEFYNRYLVQDYGYKARYAGYHIFSMAALVSEGKMKYENLDKQMKEFVGEFIILPAKEMKNITQSDSDENEASIIYTNSNETSIYCFVRVKNKSKFVPDMTARFGRPMGKLKRYDLNPNRSDIWIIRLHINPGEIESVRD